MSDTKGKLTTILVQKPELLKKLNTSIAALYRFADYLIASGVTIATDNNVGAKPLTLDELQQMAGEPIWVENSSEKHAEGFTDEWALVSTSPHARVVESTRTIYRLEYYGKTWVAYHRKPKEE